MRAACGMTSEGPVRARRLVCITRETWLRAGCTDSVGEKKTDRAGCSLFHVRNVIVSICTAHSRALAAHIC